MSYGDDGYAKRSCENCGETFYQSYTVDDDHSGNSHTFYGGYIGGTCKRFEIAKDQWVAFNLCDSCSKKDIKELKSDAVKTELSKLLDKVERDFKWRKKNLFEAQEKVKEAKKTVEESGRNFAKIKSFMESIK